DAGSPGTCSVTIGMGASGVRLTLLRRHSHIASRGLTGGLGDGGTGLRNRPSRYCGERAIRAARSPVGGAPSAAMTGGVAQVATLPIPILLR
ncbi:MAG TPA: hypothetical protein VK028_05225, partial [Micromonosporaceae bacterium]|nr:hypothetical protein [Micromonosporaceae bacterium]